MNDDRAAAGRVWEPQIVAAPEAASGIGRGLAAAGLLAVVGCVAGWLLWAWRSDDAATRQRLQKVGFELLLGDADGPRIPLSEDGDRPLLGVRMRQGSEGPLSGEAVEALLAAPSLKRLELPSAGVTDALLDTLLDRHGSVESLVLEDNDLTKDALRRVLRLPDLRYLTIGGGRYSTDDLLAVMADDPDGVLDLTAAGRIADLVTGDAVRRVGDVPEGLSSYGMTDLLGVAAGVQGGPPGRRPLRTIAVTRVPHGDAPDPVRLPDEAARLLRAIHRVDILRLNGVSADWADAPPGDVFRLKAATVQTDRVTPAFADWLRTTSNAEQVELHDLRGANASLRGLSCPTAVGLSLSASSPASGPSNLDGFLAESGGWPRLERLAIEESDGDGEASRRAADGSSQGRPAVATDLRDFAGLRSLKLSGLSIDGPSLRSVRRLPALRSLWLERLPHVASEDVAAAIRGTRLQLVRIGHGVATDETVFRAIADSPGLRDFTAPLADLPGTEFFAEDAVWSKTTYRFLMSAETTEGDLDRYRPLFERVSPPGDGRLPFGY